jgi:hypothetical protein
MMSDPNAALQQLLQPNSLSQTLFPPTSRYNGLALASITQPDGTTVAYVRRRFIPPPESYAPIGEHAITQGERLDIIAARYLGDPELFWRICDANAALVPEELEQEGRIVRITLPAGVAGER